METRDDFLNTPQRADERRGGPRYERSRCAILAAAKELFLTIGYNINLDEVAARAGVSKTTLYNHFGTKRSLLEAVAYDTSRAFIEVVAGHVEGEDIRDILLRYATEFEERSLSAEGIQFHRLVIADVSKFPDLAASLYEQGMFQVVNSLARDLAVEMAAGRLRKVDPMRTAERYLGALTGMVRYRAFAGLGETDTAATRSAYIAETIDLFLEGLRP